MALQITSPVTTTSGISLATSYARITSVDAQEGTSVNPSISIYVSKDEYINGYQPVRLMNPSEPNLAMQTSFNFEYNRQTDGSDTLMICHEKIQQQFSMWNITSVIEGLN